MKFNEESRVDTFYCTLHIAGSYDVALQAAKEFAYKHGICFQITKVDYVYTGGHETGITARLLKYPRFPKSNDEILDEMKRFAPILAEKMCQKSYTIETTFDTIYFTSDEPLHRK